MRKWLWGLLVLGALALGAGLWSTPAVAAYLCPSCFGLVEVDAGIYAEPEAEDIRPLIKAARARVAEYYCAFERQPVLDLSRFSAAPNSHLSGKPFEPQPDIASPHGSRCS